MITKFCSDRVLIFHAPFQVASRVQTGARDPQDFQITPRHHDLMGPVPAVCGVPGC